MGGLAAMTDRDEHRKACIEAMIGGYAAVGLSQGDIGKFKLHTQAITAAFDALHGIARVNPIEATEEMQHAGSIMIDGPWSGARMCYEEMTELGDLTNPPETNP
jgi:hypothetical protein